LQQELAYLYFSKGRYEEAQTVFQDLEATYRQAVGDGPGLAQLHYELARAIARGALSKLVAAGDTVRQRELTDRVEQLARSAYQQAKQFGAEERNLGYYTTFLAWVLLTVKSEPDYVGAEEVAREGVRARTTLHGVGHELTAHPRAFLV